jgi:RimJ/RimL family protein N-acetyltransferase
MRPTPLRELIVLARAIPELQRIIAHAPVDRPASGRVLQKAGFTLVGQTEDEHEGVTLLVQRWELVL